MRWTCALCCLLAAAVGTRASADVIIGGEVGIHVNHVIEYADPATWTTGTNVYVGGYAHGEMTVNSDGGLHDVYSQSAMLGWRPGASGDVLVAGSDSTWTTTQVYVGVDGDGTLTIRDGGVVADYGGTIAHAAGTTGTVTVDGPGSTWNNTGGGGAIYVGSSGNGTLDILNGGVVRVNGNCWVGNASTSNSGLSVVGSGSILYANNGLDVGRNGATGTLHVGRGGRIDAGGAVQIGAGSTATIDVTNDNMLIAGGDWGGMLTNNGTIRMTAKSTLSPGTYRPILVEDDPFPGGPPGYWGGTGTYEAVGGVWDSSAHTFTVNPGLSTTAGTPTQVNLATHQRLAVGGDLAVNFASGSDTLGFIADRTSVATLAGLPLGAGEGILSSWDFSITGIAEGSPTMLSYAVTGDPSGVRVWHYDHGTGWSEYTGNRVHVEDGHVTFVVDGFSSYAVTAAVPEPSTLALLGLGLFGLALARRRRV